MNVKVINFLLIFMILSSNNLMIFSLIKKSKSSTIRLSSSLTINNNNNNNNNNNEILNDLRKQKTFNYDINKYPFESLIKDILELELNKSIPSLDNLHQCEIASKFRLDGSGNKINNLQYNWNRDRSRVDNESHIVYKNFDDLYQIFIREVIGHEIGGGRIVYQRAPTLRVVPPSDKVTGELHRDKDYHHQPSELNYWLLVTSNCFDTNSLWIESSSDADDFKPLQLKYGQYVRFYGNMCRHKTFPNDTNLTRISLDFRCVSDLSGGHDPNFRLGTRRGAKAKWQNKFDVGGFYNELYI